MTAFPKLLARIAAVAVQLDISVLQYENGVRISTENYFLLDLQDDVLLLPVFLQEYG